MTKLEELKALLQEMRDLNCFPSSRQSKKYKVFLPVGTTCWQIFYATCKYVSCFSIGVNTPRFLCKRLLL